MTTSNSNIPTPRTDALEKAIDEFWNDPNTAHELEDSMDEAEERGIITPLKHARQLERELIQLKKIAEGLAEVIEVVGYRHSKGEQALQSYKKYLKDKGIK